MNSLYVTSALILGLCAYGCTSEANNPLNDEESSSSGQAPTTSSSSGEDPSTSSSSSSGEPSSSSGSGSSSSSSSSGGEELDGSAPDGDAAVVVPDTCTALTATGWVPSDPSLCGDGPGSCPLYESLITPVPEGTVFAFVRVFFSENETDLNTPYDLTLDPTVWQQHLTGSIGTGPDDVRYFKAESGTLNVASYNSTTDAVQAALANVKLVEVTYNAAGAAEPVLDGECLRLNSTVNVQ